MSLGRYGNAEKETIKIIYCVFEKRDSNVSLLVVYGG